MNKVILSGNLARDPEVRYTQSGKAVARASIAVKRAFASKNADGSQTDVDFFNLTVWDKEAEFFGRYFKKGSFAIIEGRLQNYSYEAKDGTKRSGVDIMVDRIEFGSGGKRQNNNDDAPPFDDSDDVDVPF